METLKSLSRRVHVAEDVQGIVRTMKSLAAARIRQFETAVESLTEYNRTLRLGFSILFHPTHHQGSLHRISVADQMTKSMDDQVRTELAFEARDLRSPLAPTTTQPNREPGRRPRYGAIIFGSDQGLCGQFNEAIADYATAHMENVSSDVGTWSVMPIGNRVQVQLAERGYPLATRHNCPSSLAGIGNFVQDLLPEVQEWQQENRFDRVVVFHNKRISSSTFRPRHLRLLPPDFRSLTQTRENDGTFATLPIFTMDRTELFRALVRQYLFVGLFRACAESLASENASRIASMQSAERTINERLGELRTQLNERRQTAITEELLDIITGYEASK